MMGVRASAHLRVAFVAPSLSILGGQAVQADRLLHAWRDDPDVAAWLVPVNPSLGPLAVLQQIRYARTAATQLAYWPLLVRELRHADVVHVFSASYFSFLLAPVPAILVAHALGKPVLLNYHSGEAPDHLRRSPFARWILRQVERSVVPSGFLLDVFRQFGLEATVISNIVELERFPHRRREPLHPRLLSTRNLEPLYNVECTLRAFRLIQARHPDAELTVVGEGTQRGDLERLTRELSLRNVTFAGRVSPDQIWKYYDAADIYIQTPDIDNMPMSVLEAYASGLAVVSTDAGGVPFILRDGCEGLLAPRNDEQAIAERVLRLLASPERAARVMAGGRRYAERCTWSQVRGQWLDVYRDLAGARGSVSQAVEYLP